MGNNPGSRILGGIAKAGSRILDIGNKAKDVITKGYNVAKRIPIIGDFAEQAVNTPIPQLGGMSANQIGKNFDKGLDVGNKARDIIGGEYGAPLRKLATNR
jgi:hypothetical protein